MTKTFGDGWLAIGDAAMAYDPLSSAGILKALNDGTLAADAIHDFFQEEKMQLKKWQNHLKSG